MSSPMRIVSPTLRVSVSTGTPPWVCGVAVRGDARPSGRCGCTIAQRPRKLSAQRPPDGMRAVGQDDLAGPVGAPGSPPAGARGWPSPRHVAVRARSRGSTAAPPPASSSPSSAQAARGQRRGVVGEVRRPPARPGTAARPGRRTAARTAGRRRRRGRGRSRGAPGNPGSGSARAGPAPGRRAGPADGRAGASRARRRGRGRRHAGSLLGRIAGRSGGHQRR